MTITEVIDGAVAFLEGIGGEAARRLDETCSDGEIAIAIPLRAAIEAPSATLTIGSATGAPGNPVQVDVSLSTNNQPVVGSQNDVIFDPALVDVSGSSPCSSQVAGKSVSTAVVTCPGPASDPCPTGNDGKKRLRVLVLNTNDPTRTIGNGPLYRCNFTIAAGAGPDSARLTCTNAIAALFGKPSTPTVTGLATPTTTPTVVEPTPTATVPTVTATASIAPPTATATATATTAALPVCVGDCNLDRHVLIDELVRGVGIALTRLPASACPAIDCHGTGSVTVDCLISAVNAALKGCPEE